MSAVISMRGIVNRFGEQVVHDGLDLDVESGEILGIVGASGSGKSVLLRTMIGLRQPNEGSVRVLDTDLADLDRADIVRLARNWGVLFQNSALFSSLTVAQNVETPLIEHCDIRRATRAELVRLKLGIVGLQGNAGSKYPSELSGGMRKRAALARALIMDPALLFLDEPTSGLDPISASRFDELLRHLQEILPLTTVLVTHDLDTLYAVCDRIAVLVDGGVIVDSVDRIADHDHPWIDEYFNGPRGRAARTTRSAT
jgi:phospholipid/cholesterol/gamma-HCH transport system ATP-binding protein